MALEYTPSTNLISTRQTTLAMAYIRVKKIGTTEYLYLVKSVWDKEERTSRQEIIKYLGTALNLGISDIPEEHRTSRKVLDFLASRNGSDGEYIKRAQERLYHALTCNDLDGALEVYKDIVGSGDVEMFLDIIFRPVLYDIGQRWAEGRIDIVTEHVASNVANSVIRIMHKKIEGKREKISVVMCVPHGENHRMGCDVLDTYLTNKGFVVYNLGAPTPSSEVLSFVEQNVPNVVMISASGEYSVQPAKKMADRIAGSYDTPVILGGYAFRDNDYDIKRHAVCGRTPLKDIPRMIRQTVAKHRR